MLQEGPIQAARVVHVVDDDEGVRRTMTRVLASAGYHPQTYASGPDFLSRLADCQAGCILLDIRMPGMCGLRTQELLNERQLGWPVLILTGHADLPAAVTALKAGALEFLQKPCRAKVLVPALEAAFQRLDLKQEQDERREGARARIGRLSPREMEILEALAAGQAHKVVAYNLGISIRTVEVHRAQLLKKLAVRSLSEALRINFEAQVAEAA